MSDYAQQLAAELNLSAKNVQGAIDLIDQGNTIPFIARYRKEVTGSMDDQGQDASRGRGPLPPLQAQAQDPRQHRQGSRVATPGRCAVQAGRRL